MNQIIYSVIVVLGLLIPEIALAHRKFGIIQFHITNGGEPSE